MPERMVGQITGRLLSRTDTMDGYPQLQLDNGPVRMINLTVPSDVVDLLTEGDLRDIHKHLMTRMRGRWRVKRTQ